MKHRNALALGLACAVSSLAHASFDPSNWTLLNRADSLASPTAAVGTVIGIGGNAAVFGTGSITAASMALHSGNAGQKGLTLYSATALTGGTVTCSWTYQSFDMPLYDNGGYFINDSFTVISANGSGPFGGTLTFSVNAGDVFGLGVRTGDGLEGTGNLTVTDFAFTGTFVPAPGGLGLVALAAAGSRRRRG